MFNIMKYDDQEIYTSSPFIIDKGAEVQDINNAPSSLHTHIRTLREQKQRVSSAYLDPLSSGSSHVDTRDLLETEREVGKADGAAWANSASYLELRAAVTRKTFKEAAEDYLEHEEPSRDGRVEFLYFFEKEEYALTKVFRREYASIMQHCPVLGLETQGETFRQSLFASYEQGWTDAVREYWEEIAPFVEGNSY